MERYTFPNQRFVCVHRERPTANFLGIKNENWMAAARDLTPHALLLYLYFAANANNYVLAVSPAAIRQAVGMPRSTYHDQFHVLEDKGYLIPTKGNTFDFFEHSRKIQRVVEPHRVGDSVYTQVAVLQQGTRFIDTELCQKFIGRS